MDGIRDKPRSGRRHCLRQSARAMRRGGHSASRPKADSRRRATCRPAGRRDPHRNAACRARRPGRTSAIRGNEAHVDREVELSFGLRGRGNQRSKHATAARSQSRSTTAACVRAVQVAASASTPRRAHRTRRPPDSRAARSPRSSHASADARLPPGTRRRAGRLRSSDRHDRYGRTMLRPHYEVRNHVVVDIAALSVMQAHVRVLALD